MAAPTTPTQEPVSIDPIERVKQRRAALSKKDEAQAEDPRKAAATYEYLLDSTDIADVAHPVDCPLPGYGHLRFWIRTNNPTKRRKALPRYEAPEGADAEAIEAYNAEYNKRLAEWLTLFVRRVEGWKFTQDGKPIPAPSARNIEGFVVMLEEMEDLASWLMGPGYNMAREVAVGNASAISNAPTQE